MHANVTFTASPNSSFSCWTSYRIGCSGVHESHGSTQLKCTGGCLKRLADGVQDVAVKSQLSFVGNVEILKIKSSLLSAYKHII